MRQVTFIGLFLLMEKADGLHTSVYPLFSTRPIQVQSSCTVHARHGNFQTDCSKTAQDEGYSDTTLELSALLAPLNKEELGNFWIDVAQSGSARKSPPSISALPVGEKKSSLNSPSRSTLSNIASIMAMNSGFLNGIGLSGALGRATGVAAVTGTYTQSALAFSRVGPAAMLRVLAIPFCYMLGSTLNALINPNGIDKVMGSLSLEQTSPLLLAGGLVLAANAVKGPLASILCLTMATGLQNSWTSMMLPGNLLRTAHYSGMTSDAGTVLGQILRGNKENSFKLPIYAKLAAGFWTGGMTSVLITQNFRIPVSACLKASALIYFVIWARFSNCLKLPFSFTNAQVQLAHKNV